MKPTAFTILLVAVTVPLSAQTPDRLLPDQFHEPIDNYSLQATSFIDALLRIAGTFQFRLGVEWTQREDTLKPVHISETSQMENGAIHVFVTILRKDARNPLNTGLPTHGFPDCHPMTAREAKVYLENGLRSVVEPKRSVGWGASIGSHPDDLRLQLPCRDVPVFYILNWIITGSNQHIWVATFPEKIAFTTAGFLEATPMYLPGTDEPFWTLLKWGEPPFENMTK